VQLIAGALDPKYVEIASEMANHLKTVKVEIVPEAGHAVHLETPDVFGDLVLNFLAGSETRNVDQRMETDA
jgi:pimeloyl-ACP methyl ester carboxylesterase